VAFADLLPTVALVTESGADILDTVILTAATDWTNSLEFADLVSTVAAVTGFGACVVGTVVLPATSWTDSVSFWTSDTRKEHKNIVRLILNQKDELLCAVQWRVQKC